MTAKNGKKPLSINKNCGLGSADFRLGIFSGNRPPMEPYEHLDDMHLFQPGELAQMVEQCGNHWRKIVNITAKLEHGLFPNDSASWQSYRDNSLFQPGGKLALLFSPPEVEAHQGWSLIMGKQYTQQFFEVAEFRALEGGFYQHLELPLIMTPYFDYRQLPNRQLEILIELLQSRLS